MKDLSKTEGQPAADTAADVASVLGAPAPQVDEGKTAAAASPTEPGKETAGSVDAAATSSAKTEDKPAEPEFDLTGYLNSLAAAGMSQPTAPVVQKAPETKAEVKEATKEIKETLQDAGIDASWLPKTDEDFDKIMESREGFTGFMQTVLGSIAKFVGSQRERAVGDAMNRTSSYVNQHVQHSLGVQELVREFYVKNPELLPIRQQVGFLANRLTAEHPDWAYDKLFDETAKQAKMILSHIQKQMGAGAAPAANGTQKAPAFAKPVSNRKQPADTGMSDLQKDIMSLMQ